MSEAILLSPRELHRLMQARECTVVDCRFDFSDPGRGRADWLSAHIPGAAYAHLDDDLASPVTESSGRHPVPRPRAFAGFLSSIGWTTDSLLVAYDEGAGAIAARLWWLMAYFGQEGGLLNGGLAAWKAEGLPLEPGPVRAAASPAPVLEPDPSMIASTTEILSKLESPELTVLDARTEDRYAGEVEPLDSRAGHIPGALNRHFGLNLGSDVCFKGPSRLRREFEALLGERDPQSVVHSCGSGVSACQNLFAMEFAGMSGSRLYPGSWSEWIRDSSRPVETAD